MALSPVIKYLAATNDEVSFGASAQLFAVNVTTATATSVITVYDGPSATGTVVALIDGNVVHSHSFYGARFPNGLTIKMTTAAAKVSVVVG